MKEYISVSAENPKFRKFIKVIKKGAGKLLKASHKNKAFLEIHLVDKRFMDKNVLAFSAPEHFPRPDIKGEFLGEIYLNPDYIEGHGEKLSDMLVHGFLHLLGYDHEEKNDRIAMEKKEKQLSNLLSF